MAVSEAFNPFPVANEAYNMGRQRAQQQGVTNAFGMVQSDPVAAQNEFLRYAAPEQATAVGKIVQAKHQQDVRSQAQTLAQGGDSAGAARSLAINGMGEDASALMKVGDDVLKQEQDKADKQAAIAHYFQQLPMEQRAATFQQYAPELVKQGLLTPEGAQNPKLDDQNLGFVQAKALGYKTTLEMEEKRRVQALAERKQTFDENKPIIAAPGSTGINPTTGQPMFTTAAKPETKIVKDAMGNEHIVQITDPGDGGQPQPHGGAVQGVQRIGQLALTKGATPQEAANLAVIAQLESSGDATAQNGRSTGLFQFHPETFARAGGGDIGNEGDQTAAALNFLRQNKATLTPALGREPTAGELYLAHQQGAGGAKALLTSPPEVNAIAALQGAGVSPKIARLSILNNGGSEDMTAGQFVNKWTSKFGGAGQQQPQGGQAQGQPGVREIYSSAPPPTNPANAGVTGPDFLKNVDPQRASQLKALSEGRMQFPSGMALSKPYWQSMLSDLAQYDPTFDAANPTTRSKTRADFTSGTSAQNITSMNTAIGHLGSLDKAIDEMGNLGWRPLNAAGQWANRQTGDDANLLKFETARDAVANELTRVFRGKGGAEADVKGWQKKLETTSSPATLHAVVHEMVDLLGSRIASLGEQYTQGMGTSAVPLDLLIPKAADTIKHLAGGGAAVDLPAFRVSGQPGGPQSQPKPQAGPAAQAPRPGTVMKGYRFNGGNPADKANWTPVQ